jgi:uncharacterized protein (UPF0264 family)
MTGSGPALLVSVRDEHEAVAALAGGADWIDLKEPRRGPLGPVDLVTARAVAAAVAGRAPLSAAAGELLDGPSSPRRHLTEEPSISYMKLGLAGCARQPADLSWYAAADQIRAAGKQLVAVVYADHGAADSPRAESIVQLAVNTPCPWVLWDTFDKSTGMLLDHISAANLATQLDAARRAGMRTVVAGRLDATVLPRLPLELIDMIAVRGAACGGSRDGAVSRELVARLKTTLAR